MNYIALNQAIFKKFGVIGQGFKGGDKKHASKNPRGYYVWINGYHQLPEISEVIEHFELGSVEYPYLMVGMGDGSGEIKYWLGITESEYILLVGVKMYANDSEDYAIDVASMVFKDRVPIDSNIQHESYSEIAGELMLSHFTHFLGKDDVEEFKSFVEESDSNFLKSVFDFYEKNFEQEIEQTLGDAQMTDEENGIIDDMDKLLDTED